LKTALLRLVEPYRIDPGPRAASPGGTPSGPFAVHRPPEFRPGAPISDLAASFQQAVIEPLAAKTARAAARLQSKTVILAGGVAANSALRDAVRAELANVCPEAVLSIPSLEFCTDNAAMVAGAGYF